MAIARSKGRLRGKQPTLSTAQLNALVRMKDSGDYTIVELAELFKVSRPTVYRALQRSRPTAAGGPEGAGTDNPAPA